MSKLKVTGIVFHDDINSGLVISQFVNPLVYLNKAGHDVSIINFTKLFWGGKRDDISVLNVPLAIPARLIYFHHLSFITIPLLSFLYALFLIAVVRHDRQYLVRGYFAGFVFSIIKTCRPSIKFVFDPRSLFIEENVGRKKIRTGSLEYHTLKFFEKYTLGMAAKTITVSRAHSDYYRELNRSGVLVEIPCYAPPDSVGYEDENDLSKFGIPTDKLKIVYFGSIDYGWNNINLYENFIKANMNRKDLHYIFITQNTPLLRTRAKFMESNVTIIDDSVGLFEKRRLLSQCDYGLFLLPPVPDSATRLGVKFVDYCTSGLPVIITKNIGGATHFINQNVTLKKRCVLLQSNNFQIPFVAPINHLERAEIKKFANQKFSLSNIMKCFS